jgi:hypothetical protein
MIRAMPKQSVLDAMRVWRESAGQLAALSLALVLAVVTFETGRHSVHHLDDNDAAACVVACVASDLSIVEAPAVIPVVLKVVRFVAPDLAPCDPSPRPPSTHQGRAPPLLLSA